MFEELYPYSIRRIFFGQDFLNLVKNLDANKKAKEDLIFVSLLLPVAMGH